LKKCTLKGRFRKNRAQYANGRGVNSPMFRIEKLIIGMILRRATMRQPYNVRECLELANSLIDKSVTQVQLVEWKQKMLGRNFTEENADRVGLKWWRNFVKQHKVHLSIRKAVQFDMKRNEWYKLKNFQQMYDFIYDKLAEKGLEDVWETEKMLDNQGNELTNKENMHDHPTKYNLNHPEKLIFVDSIGDITSQANDGNKTGTKYITGK
jgi:hypothetical protein